MKKALVLIGLLSPFFLVAQVKLSGVYKAVNDSLYYIENVSWDRLMTERDELQAENFHLTDIEVLKEKDLIRFWAICKEGAAVDTIQHIVRWDSLIRQKRKMFKEGFVMQDLEYYRDEEGQDHFIAFWNKGTSTHKVWKFDSREAMYKKIAQHNKSDLFLHDIEPVQMGDEYAFLAIFHRGLPRERTYLYESDSLAFFNEDRLRRIKSGYRIKDFERFYENEKATYFAIYEKGNHTDFYTVAQTEEDFEERIDSRKDEEELLKLFDIEVQSVKNEQKKKYKFKFKNDLENN